jgi:hypothetical protein
VSGSVPKRVRAYAYAFYAGGAFAAVGLVGFILSFGQVGSARQAAVDVHTDVPVLAYLSIAAWAVGLLTVWLSRRALEAAAREKMRSDRIASAFGPEDDRKGSSSPGETSG